MSRPAPKYHDFQIHLTLYMEEIQLKMDGPTRSPYALLQGVDVYRWSSLSHWDKKWRLGNWHTDPSVCALAAPLPVSSTKTRERLKKTQKVIETQTSFWQKMTEALKDFVVRDCKRDQSKDATRPAGVLVDKMPEIDTTPKKSSRFREDVHPQTSGFVYRLKSNKKSSIGKGTIFSRIGNNPIREGRQERLKELQRYAGGCLWRPPMASFMNPRLVDFRPGEAYVSPIRRRPVDKKNIISREGHVEVEWGSNEPTDKSESSSSSSSTSCSSTSSSSTSCSTSVSARQTDEIYRVGEEGMVKVRGVEDKGVSAEFWRRGSKGYEKELGVHCKDPEKLMIESRKGTLFNTYGNTKVMNDMEVGYRELTLGCP